MDYTLSNEGRKEGRKVLYHEYRKSQQNDKNSIDAMPVTNCISYAPTRFGKAKIGRFTTTRVNNNYDNIMQSIKLHHKAPGPPQHTKQERVIFHAQATPSPYSSFPLTIITWRQKQTSKTDSRRQSYIPVLRYPLAATLTQPTRPERDLPSERGERGRGDAVLFDRMG